MSGFRCTPHAAQNTTSVYTPAAIFPMLPERFSTDLTSLNAGGDRLAVVVEFVVSTDGAVTSSDVYGAVVRNQAKLAYNSVGAWLAGYIGIPAVFLVSGILRLAGGILFNVNRVEEPVAEPVAVS